MIAKTRGTGRGARSNEREGWWLPESDSPRLKVNSCKSLYCKIYCLILRVKIPMIMKNTFVVDIGGTKTSCSVLNKNDDGLKLLNNETFLTFPNPDLQIQRILEVANANKDIDSLSLSLPGKWDKNGVLKESCFLHDWLEYPFVNELKKQINLQKVSFETDVICGGLGEYFYGGHNVSSLLYINLGTGIGASFIQNGIPFKSDFAPTLRLQKLVLPIDEELYSAVEYISGGLLQSVSGFESVEALFDAYLKADIEAIDIISRAQTQLASILINLFYIFAPEVIVLNGGLTYQWDIICEGAIDIASEELGNAARIIPSKLRDFAPVYGAFHNQL